VLASADDGENIVIHAFGRLACVKFISDEAPKKATARESMHVEASAARIFNEKAVLVRTHRPAP
jgi:hypothetical protein